MTTKTTPAAQAAVTEAKSRASRAKRTDDKPLAQVVAEADVMPRATDKQVRAAKAKAESAARVNSMVVEQIAPKRAGRRQADPIVAPAILTADGQQVTILADKTLAVIDALPTDHVPRETDAVKTEAEIYNDPKFLANLDRERAARAAAIVPEPKQAPTLPTGPYQGPMLALRQRLKAGQYAKAPNGNPSCGDDLAQMLGALPPAEVIQACMIALDLNKNPYEHLNIGQQSMNLRNKLRHALKKGDFGMGVVTEAIEEVIAARKPA